MKSRKVLCASAVILEHRAIQHRPTECDVYIYQRGKNTIQIVMQIYKTCLKELKQTVSSKFGSLNDS